MSSRPARGPPLKWLAAALAVLVIAIAAAPSSALAHPNVVRSDPADGSSVDQGQRTVRIWFDEDIVPRFSSGRIAGERGRRVRLKSARADAGGLLVLEPAAKLGRGLYTADWTVLSAEDGHLRRGFVVFGLGSVLVPPAAGERRDESVALLDVVLRWLNLSLLAGVVGGLVVAFAVLGSEAREARRRVLGWSLGCAALALVAGVGLLLRLATTLADAGGGESLARVIYDLVGSTRLGGLWLLREALLLALIALFLVMRRRPGLGLAATSAGIVLALAIVQPLSGHAAATSPTTWLVVAVAALHLLAAGVWIGGLAAAVVCFWPFDDQARLLAQRSLRRFGVAAGLSVGVLGVTGLYYAGRQVASVDALLTTLYGQVLLVKLALLVVAGGLGLLNALLLHSRFAAVHRLRSLLVAETSIGLVVIAAAAVLTATLPARGAAFASPAEASPPSLVSSRSRSVDDVLVTLSVKPNRAGPNVFQVIAASTRRPAPAPITAVTARFRRGAGTSVSAAMLESEPGRFRLAGNYLSAPGSWRIEVAVVRGASANVVGSFDWPTARRAGRRPLVSSRPLEPFLVGAAAVGSLVLLVVFGGVLAARRSHPQWEGMPVRGSR